MAVEGEVLHRPGEEAAGERACAAWVMAGRPSLAEASVPTWRARRTDCSSGCWCRSFYLRNAMINFSSNGICFMVSFIQPLKSSSSNPGP